jgi:hypothetical protein
MNTLEWKHSKGGSSSSNSGVAALGKRLAAVHGDTRDYEPGKNPASHKHPVGARVRVGPRKRSELGTIVAHVPYNGVGHPQYSVKTDPNPAQKYADPTGHVSNYTEGYVHPVKGK